MEKTYLLRISEEQAVVLERLMANGFPEWKWNNRTATREERDSTLMLPILQALMNRSFPRARDIIQPH